MADPDIKTVQIKVTGKVHGVGFRWCSYEKFVELGLVGTAENTSEGVEIKVTGPVEKLKEFLRWAQTGPKGAKVAKMDYAAVADPAVESK